MTENDKSDAGILPGADVVNFLHLDHDDGFGGWGGCLSGDPLGHLVKELAGCRFFAVASVTRPAPARTAPEQARYAAPM